MAIFLSGLGEGQGPSGFLSIEAELRLPSWSCSSTATKGRNQRPGPRDQVEETLLGLAWGLLFPHSGKVLYLPGVSPRGPGPHHGSPVHSPKEVGAIPGPFYI